MVTAELVLATATAWGTVAVMDYGPKAYPRYGVATVHEAGTDKDLFATLPAAIEEHDRLVGSVV